MGSPLGMGLDLIFVFSLAPGFLPPTMVAVATVYSVAIYGRLVPFSMFLMYDMQESIKCAEVVPVYTVQKYDPINSMLGIYMETLNIFMLVVSILPAEGNRKKRSDSASDFLNTSDIWLNRGRFSLNRGFPCCSNDKEPACLHHAGDVRDMGSIPGLGRSPGGVCGNTLQYSCLENLMDRGPWQAIVHRVAKSWT